MSDKSTWHGGGIYSRVLDRTVGGAPLTKYYGRVWIASQKRMRTFTLGTTPKQAERRMREILGNPEAALTDRARKHVGTPTFDQLLEEFGQNYKTRGGTEGKPRVLNVAARFLGPMQVTDITSEVLDTYLRRRRAEKTKGVPRKVDEKIVMVGAGRRKVNESTLRKEIIALGTVFRWAMRRGLVERNPIAMYERPKEPGDRLRRALTPDEEAAVLDLLPPLERDVVEFAIYSGMRRGEILSLTWPSIDRGRGVIHIIGTKTGKARTLPLSLSAKLPAILDRHPRRTDTPLLFHDTEGNALDVDKLNGTIEAAMKSAGVPKVRGVMWNLFRKTWSSRLYAGGRVMPQDEAAWGGHSIAVAMKHYVEYSPAAHERAAGALDVVTVDPTVDRQMVESRNSMMGR